MGQTKIQGNVNRTRQVLLEGQRDIKSNLEKLAESITNNNKNLADELILAQAKLLYISRAVSNFYGTKIEIWAGFGWLAILKKKVWAADCEQLLRAVFSCFQWQKK